MENKVHSITWLSLLFIILTFLFFLASVFVLEFAVTSDSEGDILIPWYYWLFFAGAGVFLVVFVILQAIPVPYTTKYDNSVKYESPTMKYESPTMKYESPTMKYESPTMKYESPTMKYESPTMKYESPTMKYGMKDDTLYSLMR